MISEAGGARGEYARAEVIDLSAHRAKALFRILVPQAKDSRLDRVITKCVALLAAKTLIFCRMKKESRPIIWSNPLEKFSRVFSAL